MLFCFSFSNIVIKASTHTWAVCIYFGHTPSANSSSVSLWMACACNDSKAIESDIARIAFSMSFKTRLNLV